MLENGYSEFEPTTEYPLSASVSYHFFASRQSCISHQNAATKTRMISVPIDADTANYFKEANQILLHFFDTTECTS